MSAAPIVDLRDARKTFGGVRALAGVDLEVRPGEVHGLLGQNGCGKSTLIKLLAGFHAPDPGTTLRVRGEEVELPVPPGRFDEFGFAFVHQDLGLVPAMSVMENLALTRLSAGRVLRSFSPARTREWAAGRLARYGVSLDPDALVEELDGTDRALLAIVRAVDALRGDAARGGAVGAPRGSAARGVHDGDVDVDEARKPGLLVLDEPTVFLPRAGVERLFELVREVASSGSGVLFVSHDLAEVRQITDRVTVLRDGRVVDTVETAETTTERLVSLIVGREVQRRAHVPVATGDGAERRLRLEKLSTNRLAPFTLDVGRGEIVGLTGLMGSAYDEPVYALAGARGGLHGSAALDGATLPVGRWSPLRARDASIALVPADRARRGVVGELSVAENLSLPVLDRFLRHGAIDRPQLGRRIAQLLGDYDVRPDDPELPVSSLSGGNQQKALMAKWLQTEPSLLLLHEPTQGVDVGSREEIHRLLEAGAQSTGMAVLCASTDYDELARLCDRVVVFAGDRVAGELHGGASLTADDIAELVFLGAEDQGSTVERTAA